MWLWTTLKSNLLYWLTPAERHWVGLVQFLMFMVLSSLFPTMGYLKQALTPYFGPGELNTPLGLMLAYPKLMALMKVPGSTVAIEILPALLGTLVMTLCLIALSQVLGRMLAMALKSWGLPLLLKRETTLPSS